MNEESSALALVLGGDPALYAIVRLSLFVSLTATALAAAVGLPIGALLALDSFPGRAFVIVVMNAFMGAAAGRGRPRRVSAAVALRAARVPRHPVFTEGDDRRAGTTGAADHGGADAADRRGSLG